VEVTPPELLLQLTPPRVPRLYSVRESLRIGSEALRDVPAVLVQAPGGFGKTSLLAHWRLELLARGAMVAWISHQPMDDAQRMIEGLVHGLRMATGRLQVGRSLIEKSLDPAEGLTEWLAEVTQLASDLVLVLDDVDRLPAEGRKLLAYLLRNQPPNLRVLAAARADFDLQIDDLISYGRVLRLGARRLAFDLDDTLALARRRLGDAVDVDAVARLHEACEGWPLGLQLLLTSAADSGELPLDRGGEAELSETLLDLLFSTLSDEDLRFLEDIAVVDQLHVALCVALSGQADARERLARLAAETPLIVYAERGDWLRLHRLARERLRQRLQQRPADHRGQLHRRAAEWLAGQGLLEDAALQAWIAGEHKQALGLAERSLYEALVTRGRHSLAMEWLDRLPEELLDDYPRLQLTAAWTLSTSEQHGAARRKVERIIARAGTDEALRFECRLILGAAAVYADQPDRFAALQDSVEQVPEGSPALLQQIHARRVAWREHLMGQPGMARMLLRQEEPGGGLTEHWLLVLLALSHLWEGQVGRVEPQLRQALQRAESELGRRSSVATMLAALQSAALWELEQAEQAAALLADRLDVLERSTLPQTVVLGFCTAARMASSAGAESRALELLTTLDAVGQARDLPRLRVLSLTEQVRLHARHYRAETCRALLEEIDQRLAESALPARAQAPLWWSWVDPTVQLARGLAALAAHDWRAAAPLFGAIAQAARARRLGRLHIESQALHAFVLDRCGEPSARTLIREAMELADGLGLRQVFADAHPDLGKWVRDLRSSLGAAMSAPQPRPAEAAARSRATPSTVLTPKEREVLELLDRSLTNKEIAMALQVGDETIKWHLKNLFAKLNASTRKQAVARARLLGLLVTEA